MEGAHPMSGARDSASGSCVCAPAPTHHSRAWPHRSVASRGTAKPPARSSKAPPNEFTCLRFIVNYSAAHAPRTAAAASWRWEGGSSNEPSPVLGRLRSASSVALDINSTLSAHFGLSEGSSPEPTAAQVKELRQTFRGRKFLFPLLDQGPNNQFLQFRVAIAKARQMNRTLVLPIWLPHNPKFQHFHPGAPAVPSRDKWLDQVWYPFDVAMDAAATAQYVRVVPLHVFRALASGALGVCVAPHHSGFESYLRLSRLRCSSFSSDAAQVRSAQKTRFLGYHSYDRDLGTRDKYFGFSRPSRAVVQHANALSRRLFGGDGYIAAHVRVADGHWERSDCKHTINGAAVNSVSCGDKLKAINHSSIAAELVHVWKSVNAEASSLKVRHVFLATNMNCSDTRVAIISDLLQALQVQLVCAQQELSSRGFRQLCSLVSGTGHLRTRPYLRWKQVLNVD